MRRKNENKIKFRPSMVIVLGIVLVIAMLAQLTFLSIFGTRGKEVAKLRNQQKEVILENEMLEAEISKKQSLVRIKRIAKNQLGMTEVTNVEYIKDATVTAEK